jgi:hypothetical protein
MRKLLIWVAALLVIDLEDLVGRGVCWPRRWEMKEVYHVREAFGELARPGIWNRFLPTSAQIGGRDVNVLHLRKVQIGGRVAKTHLDAR